MPFSKGLKGKVLKGGIFLTIRQLIAALLSLVSILVIARTLGPEKYGIVATSLGIFYFLRWTGRLGLHVYLVRQADLTKDETEQVLSFYSSVGIAFCLLLWCASPAFGWWTGRSEVTQALRWLIPAIWLDMVGGVSTAMLERELRFDRVGIIDAVAQIANYSLSVPLVLIQANYWGPVAGYFLQFFLFAVLSYFSYPVILRWRWHLKTLRPILQYGLTFYCSNWIFTLKSLTVPLFVSRLAGIEAAGIVSVAIRMVQKLFLLRVVLQSMSISVMAKLMEDAGAVRRAISRGMSYQALLLGGICAVFSCFAPWIFSAIFGEKWLPSAQIFPLIALAATISAMFDLHSATLYASGHNREVGHLNFGYVGMLWLSSLLLIPMLGLWGYGLAELMALPSYFLIHRSLIRLYGSPNYRNAFWIVLATMFSLLGSIWLPPWLSCGVLIISYGVVFLLNANVRAIPQELWLIARSR